LLKLGFDRCIPAQTVAVADALTTVEQGAAQCRFVGRAWW
jgi:hypothetical protein